MKILFAPSEGKRPGGDGETINKSNLLFSELFEKRMDVISQYEALVSSAERVKLEDLFGVKDTAMIERYSFPVIQSPTMKAIVRYDGVAYEYLDYQTIPQEGKTYIDENVIVFSNLFGPIRAGDKIPDYKLKQGTSIGEFAPEKFYKKYFSDALENYIGDEEIVDLRAGFYDKFFTPKRMVTTMKFLKNGKSVSHWAKAYRGTVLRHIALNRIQTVEEIKEMKIEGLKTAGINVSNKKMEIVYDIE